MSSAVIPPGMPDVNGDGVVDEKDVAILLDKVGRSWVVVLVLALVSIAVGIICLVWPAATLLVVAVFFGAWLLVSGIVQLVQSFSSHSTHGGGRVLLAISGVLGIILGLLCFRSVFHSLVLLGIFIGIGWLMSGIATIVTALGAKGAEGRGMAIFLGVISVAAGAMLLIWPIDSLGTLVFVSGIWLLVMGASGVFAAFRMRSMLSAASDFVASTASQPAA